MVQDRKYFSFIYSHSYHLADIKMIKILRKKDDKSYSIPTYSTIFLPELLPGFVTVGVS